MPRRALRCKVDLRIRAVTAPGVWLSNREDVYLSICLFGEYRTTNLVPSIFPLFIKEDFCFDKCYYTALDPSEVVDYLEDELVVIELLQLREFGEGAIRLASYSCSARDFLFPYPSLAPSYASNTRELLLARTLDFPGIAPKLEFNTVTTVNESLSPELDAFDDALRQEKHSRRSRSRSRSRPSSRLSMRSASPVFRKKLEEVGVAERPGSSMGSRPPFVVRHLEKGLIGRLPGAGSGKTKSGKKKSKRSRSMSRPRSALSDCGEYYSDYSGYDGPKYRVKKVLRDSGDDPLPVYESRYVPTDDDDAEVAALTSSFDNLYIPPVISRSPSPLLYRSTYRDRFLGLTPSERLDLRLRVRDAIRKSRERLDLLSPLPIRRPRSISPRPYYSILDPSIDDLALETTLAKHRRY